MKDKRILSRFGIVILVLLALVLIFPSAKIDLASSIEASTQAGVRVEHIQNFARSAEMDVQLLSADDPAYQQIANVLSGLTCVRRVQPAVFLLQPRIPGGFRHCELLR